MNQNRTLIVGNWKMNLNVQQASILVHRLHERIRIRRDIELVLAPSMLALQPLSLQIDRRKFRLCAQNAYSVDEGAYTGEVSFAMLQDLVHYVIVGHSDRRHKFNESLEMIRDKVAAAIRNDISPILCVGETAQERKDGEMKQVIHDQVTTALSNLASRDVSKVVIAYEPVWALSNGTDYAHHEIPTPDTIAEATVEIQRSFKKEEFDVVFPDLLAFLKANMKKSNTTVGFVVDAFDLLYARALKNKEHAIHKIGKSGTPTETPIAQTNSNVINQVQQQTLKNTPPIISPKDGTPSGLPEPSTSVKTTKDAFSALKSKFNGAGGNKFQ